MRIGCIYVNGWASAENPHVAGLAVGFGRLLHPDGQMSTYRRNKALVLDSGPWGFEDLAAVCRRAVERTWPAANAYATEVLWPCEYDDEVRSEMRHGEYTPPTFDEWLTRYRARAPHAAKEATES